MFKKQVHFNDRNLEYSPKPQTPSPSYSISSLPSSTGPATPPQAFVQTKPLPNAYLTPVQVNPLLGYQPRTPHLLYDLSQPLDFITTDGRNRPSARALAEPATFPPLPSITILHEALPWRTTIKAARPEVGVTCMEVLETIYSTLRLAVSTVEFNSLPSTETQRLVTAAYQARCTRSRLYDEEKKKGVKRIDFLVGRNRFLGLASTKHGPDVWALHSTL